MYFNNPTRKELITVIHNNVEQMRENVAKLRENRWSENLRGTHTMLLDEDEIKAVKENYPNASIYPAEKDSYLYYKPYIYVTEHERELKLKEGQYTESLNSVLN